MVIASTFANATYERLPLEEQEEEELSQAPGGGRGAGGQTMTMAPPLMAGEPTMTMFSEGLGAWRPPSY
uniref:Uncharacterized protein n=2 Tax=Oryza brachyantha TaxID=4533 RepID=J3MVD5_ORYBR